MDLQFKLKGEWKKILESEFNTPYMKSLNAFIKDELQHGKNIYPQEDKIFESLNRTPFSKVKVVIIGQDPYHGAGQAHGLSFSVLPGTKIPPSLKNIYKELSSDLEITPPTHGCLENWAEQGILLLNNVLTVEESKPGSHRGKGWEQLTDKIVELLNEKKEGLVFILWGRDAKEKAKKVDRSKHLVLESAHPSPFSVTKFLGNKHFSKTNTFLNSKNREPIDWRLPG